MATTNSATRAGPTSGASVYDGFISYSHAADDLLAPRLQAGLQRFAKPWWRRRALRIFRDEASLSANPHLWSSITEAMAQSEWFVLLLSEDAAESVWVDREVAWWLKHKDPSRIIPVVTDGEFTWANGDISLESTAAPPSLRGVFTDEPRWVDLRFARSETQLDLRHAEFRGAIADIAATIRGVPKDELESEEIRQHKRTIRTAMTAAGVLLLLLVAATVATVIAIDRSAEARDQQAAAEAAAQAEVAQRRIAEDQTRVAQEERDRANQLAEQEAEAREDAENERDRANTLAEQERSARNEARAQRDVARSRELAASAVNVLDDDPELSVLLASQAAQGAEPSFESVSALHEALQAHRTIRTIRWPDEWPMFPGMVGAISPGGRYVAVSGAQHQLAVWDLGDDSDEPTWTFEVPASGYATIVPYFTSDGAHVVATVAWFKDGEAADQWPEPPPEVGVYIFDTRNGEEIHHFRGPRCPIVALFQTGKFLDETRLVGASAPAADNCEPNKGADIWLLDLTSGEMTRGHDESVFSWPWGVPASLSEDGTLLSLVDDFVTVSKVVDVASGSEVFRAPGGEYSILSRDGSLLLAASQRVLTLWDIGSGDQLWERESPSTVTDVRFSEDESVVYAGGHDGAVRIWDAASGELIREFHGHAAWTWFGSMTLDGSRFASFSADRTVRIWDLTPGAQGEIGGFDLGGWPLLQSGRIAGSKGAVLLYRDVTSSYVEPGSAVVFDAASGETVRVFDGYGGQMVRLSRDGKLLAGQLFVAPGILGPVHIRDVESGAILLELQGLCEFDNVNATAVPGCDENPDAYSDLLFSVDFSPDGSMIAVSGAAQGRAGVWDAATGRHLAWLNTATAVPNSRPFLEFSPHSDLLLMMVARRVVVFETESWNEVAELPIAYSWFDQVFTPDGSTLLGADVNGGIVTVNTDTWAFEGEPFVSHEGAIRDMDLSDDGALIATAGSDGFVRIWDAATHELLQAIPIEDATLTLVEFVGDRHILVMSQGHPSVVMTIDTTELIEIGRSRVTRGYTDTECTRYHIAPCPTLDEIRSGSA